MMPHFDLFLLAATRASILLLTLLGFLQVILQLVVEVLATAAAASTSRFAAAGAFGITAGLGL